MGRNRVLGSPFQPTVIVENTTTEFTFDAYLVDAVPLTVTLDPNAAHGDQVEIQDVTGHAGTSPIAVLASTGQTFLNGGGTALSINVDFGAVVLTFDETLGGWTVQLASGSSSVAGPQPTIIYRPGVPSSALAVETWPEVQAAVAKGTTTVIVDASHVGGLAHVPGATGVTDMTGVSLFPFHMQLGTNPTFTADNLQVDDGATLHRIFQVYGFLGLYLDSRTTPGLTFQYAPFPGPPTDDNLMMTGAAIAMTATATIPGIQIPAGMGFGVDAYDASIIGVPGTVPLFNLGAGSLLSMNGVFFTTFDPGAVEGAATSTLFYSHDSSTADLIFTSFGGSYNPGSPQRSDKLAFAQPSSGLFASAPTPPNVQVGQMFFATDVGPDGSPFWWDGAAWIGPSQLGPNATSAGAAPTTTLHAGAGVGATAAVTGNDTAGTITLTPGTGPAPGAQVDITFANPFPAAPNGVSLQPLNQNAAVAPGVFVTVSPSALTIQASSGDALADGVLYAWSYTVIG